MVCDTGVWMEGYILHERGISDKIKQDKTEQDVRVQDDRCA